MGSVNVSSDQVDFGHGGSGGDVIRVNANADDTPMINKIAVWFD